MKRSGWSSRVLLMGGLALSLCSCGSKNSPAPTTPAGSSGIPSYSVLTFFGKEGTPPMSAPVGAAVAGGTVWVANNSGSLQAWTTGGELLSTITGYNGTTPSPQTDAVGPDGYVYMSDGAASYRQIVEFAPTGVFVTTFGMSQLNGNNSLGMAVNGTHAYVGTTLTNGGFFDFSISGSGASKTFNNPATFGVSGPGQLEFCEGLALDGAGNIYAGDSAGRVVKYNPSGVYQLAATLASSGVPRGVVVDSGGYIYATDYLNAEIQEFNPAGVPVTQFGQGDFALAFGLAMDSSENLYVPDFGGQVVVFRRN
jgi:hypothetical protein